MYEYLKGVDYQLASLATSKETVAKIEAAIKADKDAQKGDAKKIAELSLIPLGKSK